MCKPIGNLAENLNLGNRVRPPLRGQKSKNLIKMADFSSNWEKVGGEEPPTGGKCPLMPPVDAATG